MSKQRNLRQRKKLRVGEFQEFGFALRLQLQADISDQAIDTLIGDFLSEIIAPRGLIYGGWVEHGFVAKASRGSATEEDRTAVLAWLEKRKEIQDVKASALIDAWNASYDDSLF